MSPRDSGRRHRSCVTTVTGTRTESGVALGTSSPSQRDKPFGQRRDDHLVDLATRQRIRTAITGSRSPTSPSASAPISRSLASTSSSRVWATSRDACSSQVRRPPTGLSGTTTWVRTGPSASRGRDRVCQRPARERLVGHDQVGTHDRILQRVPIMMPPADGRSAMRSAARRSTEATYVESAAQPRTQDPRTGPSAPVGFSASTPSIASVSPHREDGEGPPR